MFYEVASENYTTNKKSSTKPFIIKVVKPNTAPKLSNLPSRQQKFNVLMKNGNPSYVLVGQPVDDEKDTVTFTF